MDYDQQNEFKSMKGLLLIEKWVINFKIRIDVFMIVFTLAESVAGWIEKFHSHLPQLPISNQIS